MTLQKRPAALIGAARPLALEWFAAIRASEQEWLVEGVLPLKGLVTIFGESGAGKSFVALDWGLRIAAGMQVMNARTDRVGVAYVAAEGAAGLRKRVDAWRSHHATDGELPFAMIGSSLDLRTATSADLDTLIDTLRRNAQIFEAAGASLGVIFIDTLMAVTPGMTENNSEGMGSAVFALQRLASETGALVVVVHHAGHQEKGRPRGWSGFVAALDTSIEISSKKQSRQIKLRKQKDGADERILGGFRLTQIALRNDHRGAPILGAFVHYIDLPEKLDAETDDDLKPTERRMLEAVASALEAHGTPPPSHMHAVANTMGSRVVERSRVVDAFVEAASDRQSGPGRIPLTDRQRQAASRALRSLISEGYIGAHNVSKREAYIWLNLPL